MRNILVSLALVGLAAAAPSGQATPGADDLARGIQAHYDTVRDFQADFTQVYRGGFTKPQPEQRGQLLVKKPGRLRMNYTSPQKQIMWSDGVRLCQYDPVSHAGRESRVPRDADAPPSMLFLLDRGDLVRDFTPSLADDQPPGEWRLTLTPKRKDPEVTSMVLVVDRATLKLRAVETVDNQGGTNKVTFTTLKENMGLSDKDLAYEFPKGTAVSR
jgi:outer membrane lipoprotein carrier protein